MTEQAIEFEVQKATSFSLEAQVGKTVSFATENECVVMQSAFESREKYDVWPHGTDVDSPYTIMRNAPAIEYEKDNEYQVFLVPACTNEIVEYFLPNECDANIHMNIPAREMTIEFTRKCTMRFNENIDIDVMTDDYLNILFIQLVSDADYTEIIYRRWMKFTVEFDEMKLNEADLIRDLRSIHI